MNTIWYLYKQSIWISLPFWNLAFYITHYSWISLLTRWLYITGTQYFFMACHFFTNLDFAIYLWLIVFRRNFLRFSWTINEICFHWTLTYLDTSVLKLTVRITEFPVKGVTFYIYYHNRFPNMCLDNWDTTVHQLYIDLQENVSCMVKGKTVKWQYHQ